MADDLAQTVVALPLLEGKRLDLAPVNVVVGHYGVGKTNLVLNLALDAAALGCAVSVIDLDVVNPYFRSSEYRSLLEQNGVELIAPVFAQASGSLDVPSLTGAIAPCIERAYACADNLSGDSAAARSGDSDGASAADAGAGRIVLVDAGGDDVGAATLGCFAEAIGAGAHRVFYVVNPFRNLTHTPDEAAEILAAIEAASRLRATAIISNAHLMGETDPAAIERGAAFARSLCDMLDLPFTCATVPKSLVCDENQGLNIFQEGINLYPITKYVKAPWE